MNIDVFINDADYVVREGKPFVRLYGRTHEGKSAIILDGSFFPYFYVVPKPGIKQDELNTLKKNIEKIKVLGSPEKVSDETGNGGEENSFADDEITVKSAEFIEKKIGADKITLLKVTANIPAHIPYLKSAVHDSSATAKYISGVREYDIPFYKRYFFDRGFSPLSWVSAEGTEISKKENEDRFGYSSDILIVSKNVAASKKGDLYNGHKMAAFDLETIEEDKKLKIIMASIAATGGYAKVISYEKNGFEKEIFVKSEKELIATLSSEIVAQDPDFIITYNGDAFDFAVLDARSKDLKQKMIAGRDGKPLRFQKKGRIKAAMVKGMPHIDLFNFVARVMSPAMSSETLTLDNVAMEILGEGKKGFTWDQMKDAWVNKRKLYELAGYCMQDSLLTLKLAERITPNIFALSKLTSQLPGDASRMTYGQLVESYAMKKASQMNIVVPNKPSYDEIGERKGMEQYAGGFVKEPRAGLHESIAVFDFRGLYPSIIVTHNVDPHTLNCPCCKDKEENRVPGSDNYFCTKNRGFIPEILVELFEERKSLKQKMKTLDKKSKEYHELNARQFAVKTVSNAMYGYLGFAGSRWYNRACASAVTAFARHYIQRVISMAEEAGFEVLYGDTDSVFLHIEKDIESTAKEFLKKVNAELPGIIELDFQGIYVRGIFVSRKVGEGGAKKRYALIDKEGNVIIRGFEKVRRDWSKLAKDTQEKVLELVLNKRQKEAVELVKKIVIEIKTEKVDMKELRIYTQLTRQLKNYVQIGPHVAAVKKAVARGKEILPGETIEYVITKGTGSISDRAELIEYAKNYDPEYYINNQIVPAALRVLHIFGVTEDDLLGKAKQKGLSGWGRK
ncbi:DNA polymerase [uncultured archaeon]|nr:DNA polymerase [uncultured archaeon]